MAGLLDRAVDAAKGILGEDAVKAEALDFEQSAVGGKADVAQSGQVMQAFADAEVVGIVDGGLGAQGALLLVILLDARVFVVDVERGGDALREDAGSYPSRVLRVMISWTCSGRPRSRLAVDPRPRTTGACS